MTAGLAVLDLRRNYRKGLIGAAVLGAVGLVVSALLGYPLAGVLLCAGMALGFVNSRLVLSSVARFTSGDGQHSSRRFAFGVFQRLAVITAVAVALALTFRPAGFAVLVGLAVFQLVMLGLAAGVSLRQVRK